MAVTIENNDNRNWYIWLLMCLFAFSVILALSSCSCEFYQRKLDKKCPKVQDTLTVHDATYIPEVTTDTVVKYWARDTVVIREGKLTVKYFYNNHDSTVYLQGKCAADTVYKEIKVPYEKNLIKPDYFPNWLKWSVITLLLLIIVGFVLKKIT